VRTRGKNVRTRGKNVRTRGKNTKTRSKSTRTRGKSVKTHSKNAKTQNTHKSKKVKVKIYNLNGKMTEEEATPYDDGSNFFRKMTNEQNELTINRLLMANPHPNIIKIYNVGADYVDMELLTMLEDEETHKIKHIMEDVKTYLHSLGVIYIDWKFDNIGKSRDGTYKLFDFDVSGTVKLDNKAEWELEPPKLHSYNNAFNHGKRTPIDIDDYAFNAGLA
jgi:serine/threonine protein kinase